MATNPSEANIHPLTMDLMERMSRLEAENRELKGKMEQNPRQVDKGTVGYFGRE